jgi:hypothetical protein
VLSSCLGNSVNLAKVTESITESRLNFQRKKADADELILSLLNYRVMNKDHDLHYSEANPMGLASGME